MTGEAATELRVEIPAAAPVAVGAAAKAMAYGIEVMSRSIHGDNLVALGAADQVVTQYREAMAAYGWRLVMDRSGERCWLVEPIPTGGAS